VPLFKGKVVYGRLGRSI